MLIGNSDIGLVDFLHTKMDDNQIIPYNSMNRQLGHLITFVKAYIYALVKFNRDIDLGTVSIECADVREM